MCLIDGTSSLNFLAVSKNCCEHKITVGSASKRIDFNSYIVNLISKGTVTVPVKTEANKHAPYSGFDSDKMAVFSPF